MPDPMQALRVRIDDRSDQAADGVQQIMAVVSDRELVTITAACALALLISLLFALWAPLSNEAAAVLSAVP